MVLTTSLRFWEEKFKLCKLNELSPIQSLSKVLYLIKVNSYKTPSGYTCILNKSSERKAFHSSRFFFVHYTTCGTKGFRSHLKDEAIMVKGLAWRTHVSSPGHKPTLCWSETPKLESSALDCSATRHHDEIQTQYIARDIKSPPISTFFHRCGNPLVGNPSLTQSRHRSNLKGCVASLEAFSDQQDLVMAAEQLRIALRYLGKITGSVGVEEILNVVFQDFCIGKWWMDSYWICDETFKTFY